MYWFIIITNKHIEINVAIKIELHSYSNEKNQQDAWD